MENTSLMLSLSKHEADAEPGADLIFRHAQDEVPDI
jgi:hypothetical protein